MSLTGHAWSGFNLLANLERWRALPDDIRGVIEHNAGRVAVLQRADNDRLNNTQREDLAQRGMIFNETDVTGFRERLKPFYARWRERVGAKTWAILEAHVGALG